MITDRVVCADKRDWGFLSVSRQAGMSSDEELFSLASYPKINFRRQCTSSKERDFDIRNKGFNSTVSLESLASQKGHEKEGQIKARER
ncbi:hypothetical protein WAI453_010753 [Rhynchosporium graminicola]